MGADAATREVGGLVDVARSQLAPQAEAHPSRLHKTSDQLRRHAPSWCHTWPCHAAPATWNDKIIGRRKFGTPRLTLRQAKGRPRLPGEEKIRDFGRTPPKATATFPPYSPRGTANAVAIHSPLQWESHPPTNPNPSKNPTVDSRPHRPSTW